MSSTAMADPDKVMIQLLKQDRWDSRIVRYVVSVCNPGFYADHMFSNHALGFFP